MHHAVGVLRRAVHGVEDQRIGPGVDEVVLRSGGNDDEVALLHLLGLAGDPRIPGTADEGQDLVYALVDLLTDLPARGDRR